MLHTKLKREKSLSLVVQLSKSVHERRKGKSREKSPEPVAVVSIIFTHLVSFVLFLRVQYICNYLSDIFSTKGSFIS